MEPFGNAEQLLGLLHSADFAAEHPDGTYILALATHVVCVRDGDWLDTWDSGDETPLYYWEKR